VKTHKAALKHTVEIGKKQVKVEVKVKKKKVEVEK